MAESNINLTTEALTPEGYERLTNGEERTLQLVQGAPVELILGQNHKIVLKRGNNGGVAISIDDINFTHLANEGGSTKADELRFPAGAHVDFYRDSDLSEIKLVKSETVSNLYFVEIPDSSINSLEEKIDFTDIKNLVDQDNLSIHIPNPSNIAPQVSQVIIMNGNNDELGVAVPMPWAEQEPLPKEDLMEKIDIWKRLAVAEEAKSQNPLADELIAMAGDPEIAGVYKNFMEQEGASRETAMIVAVVSYLYKGQLREMGKEGFVAMVKGIKTAIEIGS